ncbi:MAG: mucoidy inhibitor MuiA family protein [Pseudomonadota bacterium]
MIRRISPTLALLSLLCLPATAQAQDFAAEAERRMKLNFDLDAVEGMLEAPMPSPAMAQLQDQLMALGYTGNGYGAAGYTPPPVLPLEPNSTMKAVTVFRDRALITRALDAKVTTGPGSVTFEGLPLGLTPESLNASVLGGTARIVGVELVSGQGEVEETDRITDIRAEAKELTEKLGQVRDRIESLLMQRAYLRGTLLQPGGADRPTPSLDQVKGTLTFVGEAEGRIAAQLRSEEEQAKELGEDLQPLLIKLENPLATGMQVRVDLEADKAGAVEIGLRYQVGGARWWPAYNARLDEASGHVALEYYGIVSQQTGEDWEDVALQLSTADPSTSGTVPELTTWLLGQDAYYGGYSVVDNLMGGRGLYQAPAQQAQPAQPGGMVDSQMTAGVRGSGAVVFDIPGTRSVKGDGSQQRLPVGSQTFAATLELKAVPRLVPEVYREARLRYEGSVPLLPGSVSTYTGGDYLGTGALDSVLPGEDLRLSFGTDDGVKVRRQLVSREQEHLGVGKKTVRWTFHFRISVSNLSGAARSVRLADQLPVSEVDEVKVKLEETTPADAAGEHDGPGIMHWTLALQPGQEQTVDLRFSVTAPADAAVAQRWAAEMF